jgi:hypothetical protein
MSAERSEVLNEAGQAPCSGLTGPRSRPFSPGETARPDFLASPRNTAI